MDIELLTRTLDRGDPEGLAACCEALADIRTLRCQLDAREVEIIDAIERLSANDPAARPAAVIADGLRISFAAAERLRTRRTWCKVMPGILAEMREGTIPGDRIDVITRAAAGLTEQERQGFLARAHDLIETARHTGISTLRRSAERLAQLVAEDRGEAKRTRQRKSTRARTWTDDDGMWCIQARFDPVRAAEFEARLHAAVETQHHGPTPLDCPTDPLGRREHLMALALLGLVQREGAPGGADVTVVIDERTFLEGSEREDSVVRIGLGHPGVPIAAVQRWACEGTVTPVIRSADGERLYLGRETRLANSAQRRALRVLYESCALCDTPFDHCQVHHADWWTRGGGTNIDNLLPICSHHHKAIHDGAWTLALAADRTVTLTMPDGTSTVVPPPWRAAG